MARRVNITETVESGEATEQSQQQSSRMIEVWQSDGAKLTTREAEQLRFGKATEQGQQQSSGTIREQCWSRFDEQGKAIRAMPETISR